MASTKLSQDDDVSGSAGTRNHAVSAPATPGQTSADESLWRPPRPERTAPQNSAADDKNGDMIALESAMTGISSGEGHVGHRGVLPGTVGHGSDAMPRAGTAATSSIALLQTPGSARCSDGDSVAPNSAAILARAAVSPENVMAEPTSPASGHPLSSHSSHDIFRYNMASSARDVPWSVYSSHDGAGPLTPPRGKHDRTWQGGAVTPAATAASYFASSRLTAGSPSKRRRRTAQRLLLPPRKVFAGPGDRCACLLTWVILLFGILGVTIAVATGYAAAVVFGVEVPTEIEGVDDESSISEPEFPWLQLTAVSCIGSMAVVNMSRAWLRWPMASSPTFAAHVVVGFFSAVLVALLLLHANNSEVAVETADADAGGSQRADMLGNCQLFRHEVPLGGFCDVNGRIGSLWPAINRTTLSDAADYLKDLRAVSRHMFRSAAVVVGMEITDDALDVCVVDYILPWICDRVLPKCSGSCEPQLPCRTQCTAMRSRCPFLVGELAELVGPGGPYERLAAEYAPSPANAVSILIRDAVRCDLDSSWSDSPACVAPDSRDADDQPGMCSSPIYDSATAVLDAKAGSLSDQSQNVVRSAGYVGIGVLLTWTVVEMSACWSLRTQQVVRGTIGDSLETVSTMRVTPTNRRTRGSPTARVVIVPADSAQAHNPTTLPPTSSAVNRSMKRARAGSVAQTITEERSGDDFSDTEAPRKPEEAWGDAAIVLGVNPRREDSEEIVHGPRAPPTWDAESPLSGTTGSRSMRSLHQVISPAVLMRTEDEFTAGEAGRVGGSWGTAEVVDHGRHGGSRGTSLSGLDVKQQLLAPSICHVLDYRNFGAALVLACSGACLLRLGLAAELAGETGAAVALNTVAGLSLAVALSVVADWRFLYAEGVGIYRDGQRSYSRMRAVDYASCASRLHFRAGWIRARWREYFGVHGKYFKERLLMFEAVEVIVQLVNLVDRLDIISNSELLFVISLLAVNATGGVAFHALGGLPHVTEVAVLFELSCDVAFLIYLATVVFADASAISAAQVLGLLVPGCMALVTIRTLNRVLVRQRSAIDAEIAGVVRHLRASAGRSMRSLHVSPAMALRSGSCESERSDKWESADRIDDTGDAWFVKFPWMRLLRVCRFVYSFVVVFFVVPVALVTIMRLAHAEAACSAQVGPLWAGVPRPSKRFLQDGLLSLPSCHLDTVTRLDLRGVAVEEIGRDIAQFSGLISIDARNNEYLQRVTADVARLPVLRSLLLDGTAAGRRISWSGAGLQRFPRILLAVTGLESLDLSRNSILEIPDGDIAAIPMLQQLNVSRNLLQTIPSALANSKFLSVLDVSHNQLQVLPSALDPVIDRLEHLDVRNNSLLQLPASLGSHDFRELAVAGNPVTELLWHASAVNVFPSALCDLPLRVVALGWNALRWIPESIMCLSQLEVLDVSGNDLTSVPAALGDMPRLRSFVARSNAFIHPDAVGALFSAVAIQEVDLSCNLLDELPRQMWESQTLQHLEIGFNPIDIAGMRLPQDVSISVPLLSFNVEASLVEEIPAALLDEPISSSLQSAAFPAAVLHSDPSRVSELEAMLGESCKIIAAAGTAEVLVCGQHLDHWPRNDVRESCALAAAFTQHN